MLEECVDEDSAKQSMSELLDDFCSYQKETLLRRCPVPCTQTTHFVKTTTFHQNSFIDQKTVSQFDGKIFYFNMNYDSFSIERSIETLRYDLVDFLTQAGGNLGLFLGCSCFSVLILGIKFIRKKTFWNFTCSFNNIFETLNHQSSAKKSYKNLYN